MLKSQIFPEACYTLKELTREQVIKAHKTGETITGYVQNILGESEELEVSLGENLIAYLPFEEATIYPLTCTANTQRKFPIQIDTLLKKQVRVKVTDVTEEKITLSRKQNMLQSYKHLAKCDTVYFHILNVTPNIAYGDIGDGINARLNIREVSRGRIKNVAEVFHRDDKVWVSVLDKDEVYRFNLSYKAMFPEYNPQDYKPGDPVIGIIGGPTDEQHTGYFVTVNPQVTGIMDVQPWTPIINYGTKVMCVVNRAAAKGLKLRFIKIMY